MAEPHPLLELQRLDSEADGLRARRAVLPERAAFAARDVELAALAAARTDAAARAEALAREERAAEHRVEDLRARARDVEARLYSGEVRALKELEGLQAELHEWQRKQVEAEAVELAWMEQQETVGEEVARLDARRDALAAERAAFASALAAREGEIDGALDRIAAARAGFASVLEPALVQRYERLRAAPPNRGVAAARVGDGFCLGCRATLPTAFAQSLESQPTGAVVACPRCGRLLVLGP